MLNSLIVKLIRMTSREHGQALAEYSLILAFVALVCIIALTAIGLAVSSEFDAVAGFLGGGGGSP